MKWLGQDKGTLFAEPLARAGLSQRVMISGEFGLCWATSVPTES